MADSAPIVVHELCGKWGLVLLFWVLCNAEENGTSGSSFGYNVECRNGTYYFVTIAYVLLFAN